MLEFLFSIYDHLLSPLIIIAQIIHQYKAQNQSHKGCRLPPDFVWFPADLATSITHLRCPGMCESLPAQHRLLLLQAPAQSAATEAIAPASVVCAGGFSSGRASGRRGSAYSRTDQSISDSPWFTCSAYHTYERDSKPAMRLNVILSILDFIIAEGHSVRIFEKGCLGLL